MGTIDFSERGGHAVNIEDLINDLADPGTGPDEQAIQNFTEACRRVDEDPRERQRYHDIADLIDAEDALYTQAVAALDRNDHDTALPLLRLAAEKAIGDAAWLLAVTLDQRGETAEAITWYERAAGDREAHADAALEARHAPSAPRARNYWLPRWESLSSLLTTAYVVANPPTRTRPAFPGIDQTAVRLWAATSTPCTALSPHYSVITEGGFQCSLRQVRGSFIAYTPSRTPEGCGYAWLPTWLPGDTSPQASDLVGFLAMHKLQKMLARLRHLNAERAAAFTRRRVVFLNACDGIFDACDGAAPVDVYPLLPHDELSVLPAWLSRLSRESDRRPVEGTMAAHVMLPYATIPVLAPDMTVDAALGQMLQTGEAALPAGEDPAVAGVVTLADLARSVHDSRGVPSIQRIDALMQSPTEVRMDTLLSEVRAVMTRDGAALVVVRGPAGGVVGYITASSLLADGGPGENGGDRGRSRLEVPLLGAGGATAQISVSI